MDKGLGIDVGGTSIKVGLVTPEGELTASRRTSSPAAWTSPVPWSLTAPWASFPTSSSTPRVLSAR